MTGKRMTRAAARRETAERQEPRSATLIDLPLVWLALLISSPCQASRGALFRTCRRLAALVMAHAPGRQLTMAPSRDREGSWMGPGWPRAAMGALLRAWAPPDLALVCSGYFPWSTAHPIKVKAFPPPLELGLHLLVTELWLDHRRLIVTAADLQQLHQWPRLRELGIIDVELSAKKGEAAASEQPPPQPIPQLRKLTLRYEEGCSEQLQQLLGGLAARATELDCRCGARTEDEWLSVDAMVRRMPSLKSVRAEGISGATWDAIAALPALQHVVLGSVVWEAEAAPALAPAPAEIKSIQTLSLLSSASLALAARVLPAVAAERVVLEEGGLTVRTRDEAEGCNQAGAAALQQLGDRLAVRPLREHGASQQAMSQRGRISARLGLSCFLVDVEDGGWFDDFEDDVVEPSEPAAEDLQQGAARLLQLVLAERADVECLQLRFNSTTPSKGHGLDVVERVGATVQQQQPQAGFRLHTLIVETAQPAQQPMAFWQGLTRSLPPCITRLVVPVHRYFRLGQGRWQQVQALVEHAPAHALRLTLVGFVRRAVWEELQRTCARHAPALTLELLQDGDAEEEEEEEDEDDDESEWGVPSGIYPA